VLRFADRSYRSDPLSPSNVEMGEGMGVEDSEHIQEPQNYHDDNNTVQDRLDARLHRNEPIHEPQQNSNDNQRNNNLNQGQESRSTRFVITAGLGSLPPPCPRGQFRQLPG